MIDIFRDIIAGDTPVFLLIAGPNGAGKSTFRTKRLDPLNFPCIDPDSVGMEIFGHHSSTEEEQLQATMEATRRVRECFQEYRSVGLETVFSDRKRYKIALLQEAHTAGFRTVLIFIGVDHPQVSIARVIDRVDHGGHDVPDEVIEDRFPRCFDNLKTALGIADLTLLIDNSGELRHDLFGIIERGSKIKLFNEIPQWFVEFEIDQAIQ